MNLLLAGQFDEGELEAWHAALAAVLPAGHHLVTDRTAVDPASIEVALVANPAPGTLQGLPRLRFIQSLWAGVDRLLADPSVPSEVMLARMVDPSLNAAMAEVALWAVLGLQRDLFDYQRQQREVVWRVWPQRRAEDWRVLVLGQGQMGRASARALVQRGYRVSAWSRSATAHPEPGVAAAAGQAALPGLLAHADVLLNLLPLTPDTRGLLNAALFAALPRGASVVNLARGAHLVEADLLAALDAGHLHHAVLDVFQAEPLPPAHAFWRHPRVTLLPHVAAQTDPRSAGAVVAANLAALQAGRAPQYLVDRGRGY